MPELILTCEHAGNEVPEQYRHLFEREPDVLFTHRGLDIGALELAQEMEKELKAPLFYTCTTRLLVEANRSESTTDHFSEFSRNLSDAEKQKILQEYYYPYRKQVTEAIQKTIAEKDSVIHLSVHSFTPELNGEVRTADVGLLYDPERELEALFCHLYSEEIHRLDPDLVVKDNYPYLGTADGFTTHLRTPFPDARYAGIELEVNQVFPESKENWQHVQAVLTAALKQTLQRLGDPR